MLNSSLAQLTRRVFIPVGFMTTFLGYALFVIPGECKDFGEPLVDCAKLVTANTTENGVLLCYGLYWDSSFPYYARRRALMVEDIDINTPYITAAIKRTGQDNIQALVVGPVTVRSKAYFEAVAARFNLSRRLVFPDQTYTVFVKDNQGEVK